MLARDYFYEILVEVEAIQYFVFTAFRIYGQIIYLLWSVILA